MDVLSVEQSRLADKMTVELCNTDNRTLIYKAASSVLEVLREEFAPLYTKKIVLVCGKGNNGADGLALALILKKASVSLVVLLAEEKTALGADARHYLKLLEQVSADVKVVTKYNISVAEDALSGCDVVVDALLGTGLNRMVGGLYQSMIQLMNLQQGKKIISIDIPSGINGDNGRVMGEAVHSDRTIVMQHLKLGNILNDADDYSGRRTVKDIGIVRSEEVAAALLTKEAALSKAVPKRYNVNKYHHGSVLVLGGSTGMEGAAALCATAALRSGAGLVSIAALPSAQERLNALSGAEVMVSRIESATDFTEALHKKSVVVAGMGLRDTQEARRYLAHSIETSLPLVLDAGAISMIQEMREALKEREAPTVLTPHTGELARLLGTSAEEIKNAPLLCAQSAAREYNSIVVLKMNKTVITDGVGQTFISDNTNDGMATAGSGDVLSGIIAANLAYATDALNGVCAGVYLHAAAGKQALFENGARYMNATDIILGLKKAQIELFEG